LLIANQGKITNYMSINSKAHDSFNRIFEVAAWFMYGEPVNRAVLLPAQWQP
jgi:hypothetical protein